MTGGDGGLVVVTAAGSGGAVVVGAAVVGVVVLPAVVDVEVRRGLVEVVVLVVSAVTPSELAQPARVATTSSMAPADWWTRPQSIP